LLTDIKARIRVAQIKASLSVNREVMQLYWDIGGLIVSRQRAEGWGKSAVEKLVADIQRDFPGIEGFGLEISGACEPSTWRGFTANPCRGRPLSARNIDPQQCSTLGGAHTG
jgi:hypothetical protein